MAPDLRVRRGDLLWRLPIGIRCCADRVRLCVAGVVRGHAGAAVPHGAASFVLGVLCFKDELNSILLLAIWIGVGWIAQGIAGTITAVGDKDIPGRGWQIFSGIISTLAGIVLIVYPISSIVTLTLVVGIWLIVIGVMQIGSGIGIRAATKSAV